MAVMLEWELYAVLTKDAMVHYFVDAGFCEPTLCILHLELRRPFNESAVNYVRSGSTCHF